MKIEELTEEMRQEIEANKMKKMLEFGFDKFLLSDMLSSAIQ